MTLFDVIKNFFFILIILQITPPFIENIQKQYGKYLSPHTKVGVLSFSGMLTDSEYHIKHLNSFFKNSEIKAILLKIDCPGSTSAVGQSIQHELIQLKKQYHKPVIVLVENECTSGGYYIASAADYIVAPGVSLIGSIGITISCFFKLRKFIEQFNIEHISLQAGKYKNMTSPFVDITPEETEQLQLLLNDSYQQFTTDVARNRNLPLSTVDTWANGQIFSGQQALKLGLVDEIGSNFNAIKALREKAIIEGEIEWIKPSQKAGFFNIFGTHDDDSNNSLFQAVINPLIVLCRSFLHQITISNRTDIT